jgi:hypothetical protein
VSGVADYILDHRLKGERVVELRGQLLGSGTLTEASIDASLAHCADPAWWTQTIAFTAVHARAPGA